VSRALAALAALVVVAAACGKSASESAPGPPPFAPQTIRCAIVGGMTETGFWPELVAPFEKRTGHTVDVVATGPKPVIVDAFRKGGVDLLTLHASDAIVNVVADGLAVDPQPWLRNDLLIVGPAADPAGVKGMTDAVAALGKILASASGTLLTHASMGADLVLHDLMEAGKLTLPEGRTIVYTGDRPQEVLARAAAEGAYTLVGRIPFRSGKIPSHGLEAMVQGDARLRRPYLVVVAAGAADDPHLRAARELAAYLREPSTQAWIATWGKGKLDGESVFFPITLPPIK
jgi:tungstate transport system substrate-binding protein